MDSIVYYILGLNPGPCANAVPKTVDLTLIKDYYRVSMSLSSEAIS